MSDTKWFLGLLLYWTVFTLIIILYSLSPIEDVGFTQSITTLSEYNESQPDLAAYGETASGLDALTNALSIIWGMLTFRLISGNLILNLILSGFNYILLILTIYIGYRAIRGQS